ncbi:thioesterase [Desulfonema ishimotonii]|uniref:Thioesterase n=1 Tax=Desulfonema ishimotonii TaxID=45657 RepID=A0A401FZ02_9BACT|nr:thioesterase family protein [Desulfonema ishimotonii]GBC62177.1 thioesterase [Desulfonema ishimotonii]
MSRVHLDLPGRFEFSTTLPIRISDINYGGHLANDAVLTLAHEARMQFLHRFGFSELDISGIGLVIADAVVVYRAEGFYGDVLTAEVAAGDLSRCGCDIYYRFSNRENGREIARAKTGIVFLDYATRKMVSVPEPFKKAFFTS